MSSTAGLVRNRPRFTAYLRLLCNRSYTQFQGHRHEVALFRPTTPSVRHMGIFRDFSDHLKGELKRTAELKKSVEELKEKALHFSDRTKKATDKFQEQAKEVGACARQASAVAKEQVIITKGGILKVTAQAKKCISHFKIHGLRSSYGPMDASKTASFVDEGRSERESSKIGIERLFKGLQILRSSASSALDKVIGAKVFGLLRKGYSSFIDELTVTSTKKRIKASYTPSTSVKGSTSTALLPAVKKQMRWEKYWDGWKEKIQANPLYRWIIGFKQYPIVTKSQEVAEDVRERWETSDSPIVHKIQDLNDSLFGETATAVAVREIRQRDPLFSFPDFLVEVQESTKPVLQAYLKGDLKELQKRCSHEVVDRCRAERRAYESQGIFMDNKILHISDVEVKETKLMGNTPIIIVGFQTQQIFCVRDRHGRIMQGAKDDIHTVFYAWAMQQVVPDEYQEGTLYPYWQLREMQQLGIKSII